MQIGIVGTRNPIRKGDITDETGEHNMARKKSM
jgi:hypothetical protein